MITYTFAIRNQVNTDRAAPIFSAIDPLCIFAAPAATISDGCALAYAGVMQSKTKASAETKRSVVLSVRVTPALRARLERMADEDHRTLSNLVELILERVCDDAERKRR